jgi:hypothetical protein
LEVGADYILTFWGKVNTGTAGLKVTGDQISGTTPVTITTTAQRFEIEFNAYAPDEHLLRCTDLSQGETIYLDDFELRKVNGSSESVSSVPNDVIDWVLLGLRTTPEDTSVVAEKAVFLKTDGSVVALDGTSDVLFDNVSPGDYYITIDHRNHLGIMSKNPVSLSNTAELYDFTTSLDKAYGINPMRDLGNSTYGMYSGDGNATGSITASDNNTVWLYQFLNGKDGYNEGDYNCDGAVTASDNNMNWLMNNGYDSQIPD